MNKNSQSPLRFLTRDNLAHIILIASILIALIMRWHVFTLPVQGKDSWRQSKTAWNIRYFVREDFNILHPRTPYLNNDEGNIERYEFPFMQWSIAAIEKIVGEHIIVKRLCIYVISLLTLLAVYRIAMLFFEDRLTAALSVWTMSFLPTFFYNSTNILPDIFGLCLGMFYTFHIFAYIKNGHSKNLIWASIFLAGAALTKLPYILLGAIAFTHLIVIISKKQLLASRHLLFILAVGAAAIIPLIWYVLVIPGWKGNNIATGFLSSFVGWPLFREFMYKQFTITYPLDIFNYAALLVMLTGIGYWINKRKELFLSPIYFFIPFIAFFMYFFYVLNVIREGHDYYLMPLYPIAIMAITVGIYYALQWKSFYSILFWTVIISMPLLCFMRVRNSWDISQAYMNADFFSCRKELAEIGHPKENAIIINDPSLATYAYIIDKSAYVFWNDHLPVEWIKDLIQRKQVPYLFSDSRKIESQEGFAECVRELILECGSVKVFRLKEASELHD